MNRKFKLIAALLVTASCSNLYAADVIGNVGNNVTLHFESIGTLNAPNLIDSLGLIAQADYINGKGSVIEGAVAYASSNPQIEAVFSNESLMAAHCYRLAVRAKRRGFAFEINGAALVMPVYTAPPGVASPMNRSVALLNQSSGVASGIIDPNPSTQGLAAHFSHISSCKVIRPSPVATPGTGSVEPM